MTEVRCTAAPVRLAGAVLMLLALSAPAAAVPVLVSSADSAAQTYFQSFPTVSATLQFQGRVTSLDLTPGVAATGFISTLALGLAPEDPSVNNAVETRAFSFPLVVDGVSALLQTSVTMREIANGQYQMDAFQISPATLDLGIRGILSVTPAAVAALQVPAPRAFGPLGLVSASFLLSPRTATTTTEPGALGLGALGLVAVGATARRRRMRGR